MLRYIVPDVLRTVYGTVEYGAELQEAHARVFGWMGSAREAT